MQTLREFGFGFVQSEQMIVNDSFMLQQQLEDNIDFLGAFM